MRVTRNPRASSNAPIDEAASPLPRLETTPPVTKMYLGMEDSPILVRTPLACPSIHFPSIHFSGRRRRVCNAGFWRIIRFFLVVVDSATQILLYFHGFFCARI